MTPRRYRSPARKAAADETRARIITAAQALMRSGKSVAMEAVAKRARVSRVTIYHQFESKQRLIDAAFDDLAEKGGLFSLRLVFSMPDPKAALRELVHVFCNFWSSHSPLMRSLNAATNDPDVAENARQRNERRRTAIAALVNRFTGDVGLVDVLFVLTSWETYTQLVRPGRSADDIERLVQDAVDAVLARTSGSPGATSAR